jgi:hypothetical protein
MNTFSVIPSPKVGIISYKHRWPKINFSGSFFSLSRLPVILHRHIEKSN